MVRLYLRIRFPHSSFCYVKHIPRTIRFLVFLYWISVVLISTRKDAEAPDLVVDLIKSLSHSP